MVVVTARFFPTNEVLWVWSECSIVPAVKDKISLPDGYFVVIEREWTAHNECTILLGRRYA